MGSSCSDPWRSVLAASVLTGIFLGSCLLLTSAEAASSELEVSGFTIVQETADGKWEIQARRASYQGEKAVILHEVSARMTSEGEDRISVVSDRGRYESDTFILHLEGNVAVASGWGSTFRAPNIRWDGSGAYLEASGGVELRRGAILVHGRSARYNVNTGTASIEGTVRTVLDAGSHLP
jgi:LPS export ABC transporter protein LptC